MSGWRTARRVGFKIVSRPHQTDRWVQTHSLQCLSRLVSCVLTQISHSQNVCAPVATARRRCINLPFFFLFHAPSTVIDRCMHEACAFCLTSRARWRPPFVHLSAPASIRKTPALAPARYVHLKKRDRGRTEIKDHGDTKNSANTRDQCQIFCRGMRWQGVTSRLT